MNGRVYDYNLGRFMSVDPFIQSPTSTQSVNPYSYIMNNPLSGTDPTGYACTMAGQANGSCGSDIAGVDITTETEMTNGETKVKVKIEVVNGQKNSNKGGLSTKVEDEGKSDKNRSTNQSQTPTDNSGFGVDDAASIGVGLTPAGIAADVYTAATGEDFFTGEEVSGFWRWAGLIPFVSEARKLGNAAEAAGDAATQTIRQSNHVSNVIRAPKEIPGISGLNRVKSKTPIQGGGGLRERWKDKKGKIYEWDSRHGELEMYNKSGKHLGSFDPQTGKQLGGAIKSRNIKKFL